MPSPMDNLHPVLKKLVRSMAGVRWALDIVKSKYVIHTQTGSALGTTKVVETNLTSFGITPVSVLAPHSLSVTDQQLFTSEPGTLSHGIWLLLSVKFAGLFIQSFTGFFCSFRCKVRRCIFNARAACETLPLYSSSTF